MNPIDLVNTLQGSDSTFSFSTGNTLPLAARPWGMHHWTLQSHDSNWRFHPRHRHTQGIRLTHQPSPWIGDYGSVTLLPFTGEPAGSIEQAQSGCRPEENVALPDYLRVRLLRYRVTMEMAPSERGAVFAITFPMEARARLGFWFDGHHEWSVDRAGNLVGVSRNHVGGVSEGFGLHLAGRFSVVPCDSRKTDTGGFVTFPAGTSRVELRLAGSFVSAELAALHLERELAGLSFDAVREATAAAWNELLGRISIEAENRNMAVTFTSCLYRALLFPRQLGEPDATGKTVHYSPYDGAVHDGPLSADNGFWDTFRTVYPLLALAYPDHLGPILDGWLSACREAGWSPKWASPGLRDCMIGTHFDVIVADAIVKGIDNWDAGSAFRFLERNATEPSDDGRFGRRGLDDYDRLGYVPSDRVPYSVSRTMDFAYNDFCVATVARRMGRPELAAKLFARAGSWRNVFDSEVGFMRARTSAGGWEGTFSEFRWGEGYIEGGAWQHTFNVPHDPAGLAGFFGGPEGLCERLDAMLATPPHYEIGNYPHEIHEMTEMAAVDFGQYAHSNQPVHNFLFLYSLCGQPEKTEYWVHRVANELYGPDRFPGDEDNGEMAAWYVFACLGIYPFCPGTPEYVRFPGVARSATVRVPGHQEITLTREGAAIASTPIITHEELLSANGRSAG